MTYYQQLKHREEKCIIAGINASDPVMVRMWQENALKLDGKRKEVEKNPIDNENIFTHSLIEYSILDYITRPFTNFENFRRNEKIDILMGKIFPKSGKQIADVLKNK